MCVNCPLGCKINVIYADADEIEIFEAKGIDVKEAWNTLNKNLQIPKGSCYKRKGRKWRSTFSFSQIHQTGPFKINERYYGNTKNTKVTAPVKRGDIIISNILDTGSDIIITRSVNKIN